MDKDSVRNILNDMVKELSEADVKVGKLYWVLPKSAKDPKDIRNDYVCYKITKFEPEQKRSYYLKLITVSTMSHLGMLGVKRRKTDKHEYPFTQPVMILKIYVERPSKDTLVDVNGRPLGIVHTGSFERSFVDLLVGDKKFVRVVYSPLEVEWKFLACMPD